MYLSALARMPLDEPTGVDTVTIADGRDGTFQTLKIMAGLVRKYKCDPHIRDLSIQLTSDLDAKDFVAEFTDIFEYVRDEIRYILDVADFEMLNSPLLTMEQRAGDCDDKSVLLAALLESIGHKCRFMAMGFSNNPDEFSHVIVETKVGRDTWVALDATENHPAGWKPDGITNTLTVYC